MVDWQRTQIRHLTHDVLQALGFSAIRCKIKWHSYPVSICRLSQLGPDNFNAPVYPAADLCVVLAGVGATDLTREMREIVEQDSSLTGIKERRLELCSWKSSGLLPCVHDPQAYGKCTWSITSGRTLLSPPRMRHLRKVANVRCVRAQSQSVRHRARL